MKYDQDQDYAPLVGDDQLDSHYEDELNDPSLRYDGDPDFIAPPTLTHRSPQPQQKREASFTSLQLTSYPWAAWFGTAVVFLLPFALLFAFPSTRAVWVFIILFMIFAVALACYPDWITIKIDGVSGMFHLEKHSLLRYMRKTTIRESFPLQDIRAVDVIWLGEREMRRHQQQGRPPCCHSYKTSIQASTILIVTIAANSTFQPNNRPTLTVTEPTYDSLSGMDITASRGGKLKIVIREVQDLLGCESMAVNSLHEWASAIKYALCLDVEGQNLS